METYLVHHGIKGQKWGVRRYQNEDGSYTAAGRARYYNSDGSLTRAGERRKQSRQAWADRQQERIESIKRYHKQWKDELDDLNEKGTHSKTFKDRYGKLSDREFEEDYGFTKREALESDIVDAKQFVKDAEIDLKEIPKLQKQMKKVMNAPIDELTRVEEEDRASTIATGIFATGAAAGIAAGMLAKDYSGAIAFGGAILGMIGGILYSGKETTRIDEKYR